MLALQVRPSSRAQRVQEVGLRQMAVVASGAVPQKGVVAATAPGGVGKLPETNASSAEAVAAGVAAEPVRGAAAAVEAPEADASEALAVDEDEPAAVQAGRNHTVDNDRIASSQATLPSQPKSASESSAAPAPFNSTAGPAGVGLDADNVRACSGEADQQYADGAGRGADAADDSPSAAVAAMATQDEDPVRDSSPVLGLIDTVPSIQPSIVNRSVPGIPESALAQSAAPISDAPAHTSVAAES